MGCKQKNAQDTIVNAALSSAVNTLDPAVAYDTISNSVISQIHESLYEYSPHKRPYTLVPLIAKEMPIISNQGKTYTIKLKNNIYYHPSKDLDKNRTVKALDIINQIKRVAYLPTKSKGWWIFQKKIQGLDQFRKRNFHSLKQMLNFKIPGLKAIDDYTLQINLTKPNPQFIYSLTLPFTSPIPREIILHSNNDLSNGSIGTGAYKLEKWNRKLSIELKKFERYHSFFQKNDFNSQKYKLPSISKIKFHIIKEAQTRWLSFLKNKLDFIILSKDHFSLAITPTGEVNNKLKEKNIALKVSPTLTYWWLAFNMKDRYLGNNFKLRSAIAHAINYRKFIKLFTNNVALKANSIYPPGVLGYNPNTELPFKFNLTKAKELLKLAGYPNGKGLPIIQYDVRGNTSVSRQMGEFIKAQLSRIGIKIKVNTNSFANFLNKASTGQLQMWQDGWAMDYPDAENSVQLLISNNHSPGPNATFYTSKKVDQAYKIISSSTNTQETLDNLKLVENAVFQDLPWVMMYYTREYILYNKKIDNLMHSYLVTNYFKYMKFLR
jgi:ABC-type transport system substrate-binding protein